MKMFAPMKKTWLFFMMAAILLMNRQDASPLSPQEDQARLSQILNQTAEYCERVKNIALFYVCIETIKDRIYFYRSTTFERILPSGAVMEEPYKTLRLKRTRNYSYVYDYQLIKKEEELNERRILLEKNNKKKQEENAELEVRYSAKYLVYGPVGFLSRYWQDCFNYELIGHETIGETLSAIVKATPRPENEENRNSARIWIDEKDGSILQIEWEPESILDYEGKKMRSQAGDLETAVVWRVTYGIEKNGVRFPSQQKVEEFLQTEEGKRFIRNETVTTFDNYRFFVVETEIKHHP
jgi:hypothetical protein